MRAILFGGGLSLLISLLGTRYAIRFFTRQGFGQPIRHMFGSAFRMERELPSPWDTAPRYRIQIEDRLWRALYVPLGRAVQRLADLVAVVQGGRLSVYLLYAFLTLIGLLVFVL